MIVSFPDLCCLSYFVNARNHFFPEFCHVAYQIKGNQEYNYMLAIYIYIYCLMVYLIHTLTPRMVSKDQIFFFSESSHVAYLINGNEA